MVEENTKSMYRVPSVCEHLTKSTQEVLTKLVDRHWERIRGTQQGTALEKSHGTYESLRAQYRETAVLATLCDHATLDAVLDGWSILQKSYAKIVKAKILAGKEKLEGERKTCEELIEHLKSIQVRYDELSEELAKTKSKEERRTIVAKLTPLQRDVDELDKYEGAKKKIEGALRGIECAAADLQTILDLEGVESIHYAIASPEIILAKLEDGTYASPTFEPFAVVQMGIKDVFMRGEEQRKVEEKDIERIPRAAGKPLDTTELPDILNGLLQLKRYVDELRPGRVFTSKEAREAMGREYMCGAKGVGGWLERGSDLFGVTCEKKPGREFTRRGGLSIADGIFLAEMLERFANPADAAKVSEFYIKRALAQIREQPIAYEGFDTTCLLKEVQAFGYPATMKQLGMNLAKKPEVYGLQKKENDDEKPRYVFADVIPTDRQRMLVQETIPTFGYDRISVQDIRSKLKEEKDYDIHLKVTRALLEALAPEFGLVKVSDSPTAYQRKTRPKGSGELLKGHRPDPSAKEGLV